MSTPQDPAAPTEVPRPGRRVLLRGLIGALAISLFIGVGVATAVVLELKNSISIFQDNSTGIAGADSFLDDVDPSGAQTILVLGSDKRYIDGKNGASRSDSMLLVRLDPTKAATTVCGRFIRRSRLRTSFAASVAWWSLVGHGVFAGR